MSDAWSDAELVRRVAEGSGEAETEVCRRMGPRVRLYGLRHLRSEAAADDLVQLVLLRLIEALRAGRLNEPDKLAPFALGTCRMTVLDLRRGDHRRGELLGDLEVESRPAPELDTDRLEQCVQTLAERERTVVVLTFYDERAAPEIAGFMGTSEGNVRVIRHRAIQKLRTCMGAEP